MNSTASATETGLDVRALIPSWKLSLASQNLAETTQYIRGRGMEVFLEFAEETGVPTSVGAITREHLELFHVWMQKPAGEREAYAPSSILTFHEALRSFFAWSVEDGEIATNPMDNVARPIVPERAITFPTEAELRAVLNSIKADSLESRRDKAQIRLLAATGLRLAELTGIRWSEGGLGETDLVLDAQGGEVTVMGKGRKERTVSFGSTTARALDRYLRARRVHPNAGLPWLWISSKGRLTTSGIRQMLNRRGDAGGFPGLHPHQLRHYMAHQFLAGDDANGIPAGSPEDLMRILGHANTKMIQQVYGAAKADERARAVNRRLSPGDRL